MLIISKLQYEKFLESSNGEYNHYFLDYWKKTYRLDKFLGLYIDRKKFDKSWNICKRTFTLSNVQDVVERGFSVNKEIVENLKQKSLISQKMVHDYVAVKYASSHHEYNIPNSLILKCKSPHARYV